MLLPGNTYDSFDVMNINQGWKVQIHLFLANNRYVPNMNHIFAKI